MGLWLALRMLVHRPSDLFRALWAMPALPLQSEGDRQRQRRMHQLDRCIGLYILTWFAMGLFHSSTPAWMVIVAMLIAQLMMWISRREWDRLRAICNDEHARFLLAITAARHEARA